MDLLFTIEGPFQVEHSGTASKNIEPQHARKFWESSASEYINDRGVYVFCVKRRAYLPIYVGKATKRFGQEVFGNHQLICYNRDLFHRRKGAPFVFLLVHPRRRGPVNKTAIGELERHIIQLAKGVNPNLMNTHHTAADKWAILGLGAKKDGAPTRAISALRTMLQVVR
jgi:hypothetical protein